MMLKVKTLTPSKNNKNNNNNLDCSVRAHNLLRKTWPSLPIDYHKSNINNAFVWNSINPNAGGEPYLGKEIGKSKGWHHRVHVTGLIPHDYMHAWVAFADTLKHGTNIQNKNIILHMTNDMTNISI